MTSECAIGHSEVFQKNDHNSPKNRNMKKTFILLLAILDMSNFVVAPGGVYFLSVNTTTGANTQKIMLYNW